MRRYDQSPQTYDAFAMTVYTIIVLSLFRKISFSLETTSFFFFFFSECKKKINVCKRFLFCFLIWKAFYALDKDSGRWVRGVENELSSTDRFAALYD